MKIESIRNRALELDLNPEGLDKVALIREIQLKEGNFDCFARASGGECDQTGCIWRKDCITLAMRRAS